MLLTAIANFLYASWVLANNFIDLMAALCTIDDMLGWDLIPDGLCDAIPED
jgi:hypothetical protein